MMIHSALGSQARETALARKRRRRAQATLALAAAGLLFAGGAVHHLLGNQSQPPSAAYAYFSN